MAIENYGVWAARAVEFESERAEDDPNSPHVYLYFTDSSASAESSGSKHKAAINVKSKGKISELVFWLDTDFRHPITDKLIELEDGFHHIAESNNCLALDYIRGNLMNFRLGRVLPHDLPEGGNDILDNIEPVLYSAIKRGARIFLFGEQFSDGTGIHDVHMNQGSAGRFAKYNGVWQDGGLIIYYPDDASFSALFLAFASQGVHTGDISGDTLPGSMNFSQLLGMEDVAAEAHITDDMPVAITAALVNPAGSAGGRAEAVYLINRSDKTLNLDGWALINYHEEKRSIDSGITLSPGGVHKQVMHSVSLADNGGLITLVDASGVKVDGVSYTAKQASQKGYLVVFR